MKFFILIFLTFLTFYATANDTAIVEKIKGETISSLGLIQKMKGNLELAKEKFSQLETNVKDLIKNKASLAKVGINIDVNDLSHKMQNIDNKCRGESIPGFAEPGDSSPAGYITTPKQAPCDTAISALQEKLVSLNQRLTDIQRAGPGNSGTASSR